MEGHSVNKLQLLSFPLQQWKGPGENFTEQLQRTQDISAFSKDAYLWEWKETLSKWKSILSLKYGYIEKILVVSI